MKCEKCNNAGYWWDKEPEIKRNICDCVCGQIYSLNLSLVGPKLATAEIEQMRDYIQSMQCDADRMRDRMHKMEKLECPDCEFRELEMDHLLGWTRPLYKKLREEIKELKKRLGEK